MAGILFIISAPSGSGKSTLVSEVRRLVEGLEFSISYTTRAPRGSEEDGREYSFISRDRFERLIEAGEFLEWAEVFGNLYGTARMALWAALEHGKDLLLDIDVQGAMQVMQNSEEAIPIFILPPSPDVLELRLRNRSQAEGVTEEALIGKRLNKARAELRMLKEYKYALVNDVLDHAVQELRAIVLRERGTATEAEVQLAETCLVERAPPRLLQALASFDV